jgi:hypothetical protein
MTGRRDEEIRGLSGEDRGREEKVTGGNARGRYPKN